MTTVLIVGVASVVSFVVGVLFGRRNKKKVEAVVNQANKLVH